MQIIKRIAFVVNENKQDALSLAKELVSFCDKKNVDGKITTEYPIEPDFFNNIDICCTIGGDGTLLGVINDVIDKKIPILGINRGKLGFLATLSADCIFDNFEKFLQGHFIIEQRSLLKCKNLKGEAAIALNDIVIYKGSHSRLVHLQVFSNKELVSTYRCDGLIFTTPTGSTAYNLSADGPIIMPSARVIGMTPICPHTLSNRSVVFDEHSHICVHCLDSTGDLLFMADGRTHIESSSCTLEIQLHPKKISLVLPSDYSHFHILRTKLNWGD